MVRARNCRRRVRFREGFGGDLTLATRSSHVWCDEREGFSCLGRWQVGVVTVFGIKVASFAFQTEDRHFSNNVAVLRVVGRVNEAPEVFRPDSDDLNEEYTDPKVESAV